MLETCAEQLLFRFNESLHIWTFPNAFLEWWIKLSAWTYQLVEIIIAPFFLYTEQTGIEKLRLEIKDREGV